MTYEALRDKIEGKSCVIGILGLGYVGLPVATLFAHRGYKVMGGDINKNIVRKINQGESPISENGLKDLVKAVTRDKKLFATANVGEVVKKSDVVFIIVQTPIDENKKPDLEALKKACTTIAGNLDKGKLVIVESTVPPSATKELVVPILEAKGLRVGVDFYLAYSPERAIPTRTLEEIQTNSRIIGGINEESGELARLLYKNITAGELIIDNIATVEVVKIIENTYRDVNIALANEIALICEKLGVDATRAIEIANKHPRVHLHMPGAGVGGHCIPKDPCFLIDKANKLGVKLKVISAARELNENMPKHVLRLIETALKSVNKSVENAKISILGVAYKGNTDDTRSTPAEGIIKSLIQANCEVFSHDPHVTQDFGGKFSNRVEEAISDSDCVVIVTDHDEYRSLDLKKISKLLKKPSVIVDGRRILNPEEVEGTGISYFGVGY